MQNNPMNGLTSHIRTTSFAAFCAAMLFSGCGSPSNPASTGLSPPHVIVVSLDTLRADRLGLYGYERETDPALQALAADSVVFSTVASQATQTLLSHKSWFASRYPLGIVHDTTGADLDTLAGMDNPTDFLVDTFRNAATPSLVPPLAEHGYLTAAFVDGGWLGTDFGFQAGFEAYDDRGKLFGKLVESILPSEKGLKYILPRAMSWIRSHREDPFFLFLHTYDIHCPYHCREPYDTMFCDAHAGHIDLAGKCGKTAKAFKVPQMSVTGLRAVSDHYDGGIASADAFIADLVTMLRDIGMYDEALLIITSDHGESLGEHSQIGHGAFFLEQIAIPLIIKLPQSMGIAGRKIDTPVELIDVFPTVFDVCGIPAPNGIDGRSLLPAITTGAPHRRGLISQITFRELPDQISGAAKRAIWIPGQWLLVHDARGDASQVFDLAADPKGLTDIAASLPEAVPALLQELVVWDPGDSADGYRAPEPTEMDPELVEQLRSLGYLN